MELDRAAGILLHVTSLPGPFGVGDFGCGTRRLIDFLQQTGQSIWQILPLSPPLHGNSPYSSASAFAGNPLFITPDGLHASGWLTDSEYRALTAGSPSSPHCDYTAARRAKLVMLHQAFRRFLSEGADRSPEYHEFCQRSSYWLDDYALFAAACEVHGTDDWSTWAPELARRDPEALERLRKDHADSIAWTKFVQYVFDSQWREVWHQASAAGIRVFGDLPIFVAYGSSDVWAHQHLFCLDHAGKPTVVAGVPPDYFSRTGQLWGNPLYDWQAVKADNYRWWVERLKWAFQWHDVVRIDHFRAFEAYWEIPAGARTAVGGRWVPGPGREVFDVATAQIGPLNIVAEDLGMITPEVHALREALGMPGMRVLQFGFDSEDDTYHRPESYPHDCVAYTGTHDNSTIIGWYQQCPPTTKARVGRYLQQEPQSLPLHLKFASMLFRSQAGWAIVPMQDLLGLDDRARMNVPGRAEGNWTWRLVPEQLTEELSQQVRTLSCSHGRARCP
ncbi:MAG: 4-alpha-glucanotransferase [Planctomycetota bacterium]|nr:MAG: 4-alpha-glucanotransferase [Planctomycetota bacterium]